MIEKSLTHLGFPAQKESAGTGPKREERRAHLELQVNLLTEQKGTKLINLIEELRQDLPMVKSRDDPESGIAATDRSEQVLSTLDGRRNIGEPSIPGEGAKRAGRAED